MPPMRGSRRELLALSSLPSAGGASPGSVSLPVMALAIKSVSRPPPTSHPVQEVRLEDAVDAHGVAKPRVRLHAVPVHVVEPVDGRVDLDLACAVGRREVEALLPAAARLEA